MRHTPPDSGYDVDVAQDETADRELVAEALRLARDAYAASSSYFDSNVRADIEADLRQWQGRHARGSRYANPGYANRSKLFVPKTRAAITKLEAIAAEALFSAIDVVAIEPYDREDREQVDAAAFYGALIEKRLHEPSSKGGIPWFLTVQGAYQESLAVGVAISRQSWEYDAARGRNRPRIDLVPVENFRWDPGADWRDPVATSPYLILEIPMYVRDIRARIRAGQWNAVDEGTLLKHVHRFSDSVRQVREQGRQDSKDVGNGAGDYRIVWVREVILELDGRDVAFHTLGDSQMLSREIGAIETLYAHGRPYVVGFSTIEAHRHYPSSLPRLTADLQRETNDLRNQRIDNVSFVLNKRYFVRRHAQVDIASITRNAPGAASLMQDPDKDVRVVETPDVTSSAYAEQDRLNVDFDDLVGQFSGSSVQSNRALNETVGGMNLLTANANQVGAYRLRTFVESWVEPVLRQLVELERQYEDDPRFIEMARRQAGLEAVEDYLWGSDLRLACNVGMSATSPTEKANMIVFALTSVKNLLADGALEQRGIDIEEVVKEVFAAVGYRDGRRFFTWNNEDPQVAMLKQQLQQLQQALDAKTPPEVVAAQVEKLSAEAKRINAQRIGENVRSAYSAMQAGQVIASVPSVAPVADEIMQSAGWHPAADGVDPNFPQPAQPDPALVQNDVMDRRTGVGFMPGGNANTSPAFPPVPGSPEEGADQGIETMRPDGT